MQMANGNGREILSTSISKFITMVHMHHHMDLTFHIEYGPSRFKTIA